MGYNGAFEAWRVHPVNNLSIDQASLCSITGKKYNHVKIGGNEEIWVHFYQILMDNTSSELQLGGGVNSKEASLENAELSQIRHIEKQTYSGRYGIKKSNFTWTILFLN